MPAVSVIVPVYKVEPFVARCARSLFAQTLADLEFIFVDDCSPDKSVEIISQVLEQEFPGRKPQVRFFRMPVNSGVAKVRMQGIALAEGDYVIHCDSDDELVSPDAYLRMYEKALQENLDIVFCNYYEEDASLNRRVRRQDCRSARDLLLDRVQGNVYCRMVRRTLLEGVLPPVGNMGEDLVLALQTTLRATSYGHVDEPFYLYKYRPASISKAQGRESAIRRHQALTANVLMLVGLLTGSYGYKENDPEIACFKYYARHCIEPYVGDKACYQLWRETFPEVDAKLLANPYLSLEKKGWFVLIHMHLYDLVKRMTRRLGKRREQA